MADDSTKKTSDTAAKGDGASTPASTPATPPSSTAKPDTTKPLAAKPGASASTPSTSTPSTTSSTPAPSAATSTTPPVPNSGAEPVAQEAATAASSVRPPLPADYEMPDDYADQDWVAKTKSWVEEHPVLAIGAASVVGIVAGRIVTGLFPDPEPSLADRVEDRAKVYKKEAAKRSKAYKKEAAKKGKAYRKSAKKEYGDLKKSSKHEIASFRKNPGGYAEDLGESLEDALHRAAAAIRHGAHDAGEAAEEGYERTKDFVDTVSDAVKVALTGVVAAKIDDWVKKVRD